MTYTAQRLDIQSIAAELQISETTAKRRAMVTVHVYSNDLETATKETVGLFTKITDDLKAQGFRTVDFPNGG